MSKRAALSPVLACTLVVLVANSSLGESAELKALGLATPRDAWTSFLDAAESGDWNQASRVLDLSLIPERARASKGRQLARNLHQVSLRSGLGRDLALSGAGEGVRDEGLPPEQDLLGIVGTPLGDVSLLLTRLETEGQSQWRLASRSVAQIPLLHRALVRNPLESYLPSWALRSGLLDLALYQWACLLLVPLPAWFLVWPLGRLSRRGMRRFLRKDEVAAGEAQASPAAETEAVRQEAEQRLEMPVRLLATLLLWGLVCRFLSLPESFSWWLDRLQLSLIIAAAAWLITSLLAASTLVSQARLKADNRAGAASIVALLRRTGSLVVWTIAALALMQNMGLKITGVLGALGVGGIAVALAAQKTVENLFGGVALLLDQPVRVGDYCKFGQTAGNVEEVGFRSVRVRTLDRTVITIPNGQFSELQIENYGQRDRIRLFFPVGLRYETSSDQLRHVLVELRRILLAHPRVIQEDIRVRFVGFGASSLDLEVLAYVKATVWKDFLAIREDILLRFMDAIAASGTGVAFPSQTTYFTRDPGLDSELSEAAEKAVAAWRGEGALSMPDPPLEDFERLRESLSYPPEGSNSPRPEPPAESS